MEENNVTLIGKDILSAKLAECYITIGENRYNFMQARNVEAKFEKTKKEVYVLGKTGAVHRSSGWKGTGSANFFYNTSIFREMMLRYKETGEDVYFDMQITNEDPTSSAGRQTITLLNCNIDSGILAKFDTEGDELEEDIDFTFDDFNMPEEFNLLEGMLS